MQIRRSSSRRDSRPSRRRGAAALWVIAAVPALVALLVLVADVARLWQARAQLENAAASGALAGAKVWGEEQQGEGDDERAARAVAAAEAFARSNAVLKLPLTSSPVQAEVGGLEGTTFTPGVELEDGATPACRVQAAFEVESLWPGIAGPYVIQAAAVAASDDEDVRLVRVTHLNVPSP